MTSRAIIFLFFSQFAALFWSVFDEEPSRAVIDLNDGWISTVANSPNENKGFQFLPFDTAGWIAVDVPHNWDRYEGYRRLKHGNKHGSAWYRKTFRLDGGYFEKRFFLYFEGIGSYATVYLNSHKVGEHAGGRTTFTLDVTQYINPNGENLLAVQADHPAGIQDLPWVCGGCSDEVGFSEGSQPLGIFRPVQLIVTNEVRIEPFGVHIWNDTTVSRNRADLNVSNEIKNYGSRERALFVTNRFLDSAGVEVSSVRQRITLAANETKKLELKMPAFEGVQLWSPNNPYLYQMITEIHEMDQLLDQTVTPYGIRWVKWDIAPQGSNQFYLNGEPFFLNGTAEYEHNMGRSHAFDEKMIKARVAQMRAAGFNAFRDAHQPHNLRYMNAWDSLGMLCWTQMAAHIWYDNPEFKTNFKTLLAEWVRERRNSPSVILWGLENESTLPEGFARECTELIRALDPTASSQRLVTTCNGGEGTDWDVPQNWTGTYGGNPDLYHEDVVRQQLIGEYGAWRTLDAHEKNPFSLAKVYTENGMTDLMEKKVRLADSAKEQTCGHFHWIFTSHENPGRNQSGEAFRELDRVGPINYKGLFSPWGEPADVFYMFRAHHTDPEEEPMVYIESHTWPNRWEGPGVKNGIKVFSNCEEVELFCGNRSLGRKSHPGFGKSYVWDSVLIDQNLLHAKGYQNDILVAEDHVTLHHLPKSEALEALSNSDVKLSDDDQNYMYRMNCGGPDYVDTNGNLWTRDRNWQPGHYGSVSWTQAFDELPAFYASQRRTFDPIFNTEDGALFQTFRYGQDQLAFRFPVEPGDYTVELHFIEPWYGTGGGLDCTDWRVFDVAINDKLVLDDFDIWLEAGHDKVLIKKFDVSVDKDELVVHFPEVKSGQALISAIAISSSDDRIKPVEAPDGILSAGKDASVHSWLDWGAKVHSSSEATFHYIPAELMGGDWVTFSQKDLNKGTEISILKEADVYLAVADSSAQFNFLDRFDYTKQHIVTVGKQRAEYQVYKKRFTESDQLKLKINDAEQEWPLIVLAIEAADMQPPFDLKPKVPYDEDVVVLNTDGFKVEEKYGLGCVTVIDEGLQSMKWPISTGVADFHAIHFKFSNETGEPKEATFKMIAADGTLMQEEVLVLEPTPSGKYREVTTFTDTMINAGYYHVQLEMSNALGLGLRGIRVQ